MRFAIRLFRTCHADAMPCRYACLLMDCHYAILLCFAIGYYLRHAPLPLFRDNIRIFRYAPCRLSFRHTLPSPIDADAAVIFAPPPPCHAIDAAGAITIRHRCFLHIRYYACALCLLPYVTLTRLFVFAIADTLE